MLGGIFIVLTWLEFFASFARWLLTVVFMTLKFGSKLESAFPVNVLDDLRLSEFKLLVALSLTITVCSDNSVIWAEKIGMTLVEKFFRCISCALSPSMSSFLLKILSAYPQIWLVSFACCLNVWYESINNYRFLRCFSLISYNRSYTHLAVATSSKLSS